MAYNTADDLTQIISLLGTLGEQQTRRENREKANINNTFNNIGNAYQGVNSIEGIDSLISSLSNVKPEASRYGDTNISYDVMEQGLKGKKAQLNMFNTSVDQANDLINSTTFLEQTTDYTALTNPDSDIYSMIMGEKNADGTQRFPSITDWVTNQYSTVNNLDGQLKEGIDAGYIYNKKNLSDRESYNKINTYKKQLDVAMQSLIGDEIITPEEAQFIAIGDRASYDTVKNNKLIKIKAGIEEYDEILIYLDKALSGSSSYIKARKDLMSDKEKNSLLQGSLMSELGILDSEKKESAMEKINEVGLDFNSTSLRQDIIDAQTSYEESRNQLIDSWKMWDGYDYQGAFSKKTILGDDGGLGDYADNVSSEVIVTDDNGLPETNEFGMTTKQQQEYNQDLKDTYGTTDLDTIKGYLSGELKKPPTQTLMLPSNKGKLNMPEIEKIGGEEILMQFIKGDISENDMESFLNTLKDFDIGTLTRPGAGMYKYFNPANYFGKGIADILSLKDMQTNYQTTLSIIPGVGIPVGKGKKLLEIKDTDSKAIKEYKEKVKYIGGVLDEWVNIEDSNAGEALKKLMNGNINITQALNEAGKGVSSGVGMGKRTDVFGSKKASRVTNFIKDYNQRQNKLSLQDFINQNKEEFNSVARILKYGRTLRKSHK